MSRRDRETAPVVPAWPVVYLTLDENGHATVDGRELDVPEGGDAQHRLLGEAIRRAADLGRPLRVRAVDPTGTWQLAAYPDGEVVELADDLDDEDFLTGPSAEDAGVPGPWHLRIHPNGVITPVDEIPVPTARDYVPRPPAADPAPVAPADHVDAEPADPVDAEPADPVDAEPADAAPSTATRPVRHRPLPWIPVAVGATLSALAVGGVVIAVRDIGSSAPGTPVAVAPARTGGTPAAAAVGTAADQAAPAALDRPPAVLDIGPPPGFSAKPLWALPVAGPSSATVAMDGLVAVRTSEARVAIVDPSSGSVRWHAPVPPEAVGPQVTRVEGTRAVAVRTGTRLLYWPLDANGLPSAGDRGPVEITLPSGSTVSWSGPSPLVTLSSGAVAVIRRGSLTRVALPTGARALAADDADVLAVTGRDWVRQPAGESLAPPRQLEPPPGATDQVPLRVENVGGSFLGAAWAGPDGPIVAVYDTRTGARLIEATFPRNTDFVTATAVREPGSDRTALGAALFDPARRNLSIISSTFTPVVLTAGHVYGRNSSGSVAELRITGKQLQTVRFPRRNPIVPAGITTAGSRPLALVTIRSGPGWLVCALPGV